MRSGVLGQLGPHSEPLFKKKNHYLYKYARLYTLSNDESVSELWFHPLGVTTEGWEGTRPV